MKGGRDIDGDSIKRGQDQEKERRDFIDPSLCCFITPPWEKGAHKYSDTSEDKQHNIQTQSKWQAL